MASAFKCTLEKGNKNADEVIISSAGSLADLVNSISLISLLIETDVLSVTISDIRLVENYNGLTFNKKKALVKLRKSILDDGNNTSMKCFYEEHDYPLMHRKKKNSHITFSSESGKLIVEMYPLSKRITSKQIYTNKEHAVQILDAMITYVDYALGMVDKYLKQNPDEFLSDVDLSD